MDVWIKIITKSWQDFVAGHFLNIYRTLKTVVAENHFFIVTMYLGLKCIRQSQVPLLVIHTSTTKDNI